MANIVIDTSVLNNCRHKFNDNIEKCYQDLSEIRNYVDIMESSAFSGKSSSHLCNKIRNDLDLYTTFFDNINKYGQALDNIITEMENVVRNNDY